MIELVNVSKYFLTDFGRHYVFKNVNLVMPLDKSVAVIGPNGAGKSTFLRLLGGADQPSTGSIVRVGRISPPMGLTPGLQPSLNGVENARFAGRIYGMEREDINNMIEYVRNLANIGRYFDMPVSTYSAGMRQRVSFAINMSMKFDYYLFDEIGAGGDRDFRKIAKRMVQERLASSKFIMTSHNTGELLELCDSGIVIQNGELRFFEDVRDAVAFYGEDPNVELMNERAETGEITRQVAGAALDTGTGESGSPDVLPPIQDRDGDKASRRAEAEARREVRAVQIARKKAATEAARKERQERRVVEKAAILAARAEKKTAKLAAAAAARQAKTEATRSEKRSVMKTGRTGSEPQMTNSAGMIADIATAAGERVGAGADPISTSPVAGSEAVTASIEASPEAKVSRPRSAHVPASDGRREGLRKQRATLRDGVGAASDIDATAVPSAAAPAGDRAAVKEARRAMMRENRKTMRLERRGAAGAVARDDASPAAAETSLDRIAAKEARLAAMREQRKALRLEGRAADGIGAAGPLRQRDPAAREARRTARGDEGLSPEEIARRRDQRRKRATAADR